ncbi:hypothetical protein [Alkalicoccus daliensis]|uniref:Uncharacterized protein n=1 Tax=Alkalicoccus daliensis TaxID=745820 RepID=A0A1H0D3N2_9BACI|nr:hypothetical protein [Alkalicoccus daliensis]SDN64728.1 hypothetical protein SAMN04488053_102332 [Alkalicoccus daliensis]
MLIFSACGNNDEQDTNNSPESNEAEENTAENNSATEDAEDVDNTAGGEEEGSSSIGNNENENNVNETNQANNNQNTNNDINEENEADNSIANKENTEDEEADSEDEVEYAPEDEGEEREAVTAKEDNYMQDGTFTGGEVTDGKSVGAIDHGIHEEYERLVLDIYDGSYQELEGPADIPNHFEVSKEAYPERLVYTLSGIRGQPEEIPDLSNMNYFYHMDIIPLFDDATIQFAVYLQESIEFEVFEMHEPAKIVTDVRPEEEMQEYKAVYSLRTASIPQDGDIEDIQRREFELGERDAVNVRTLHSEDKTLTVEEGYYQTLEEAEERKAELENEELDFELHIEERGMHGLPENIE